MEELEPKKKSIVIDKKFIAKYSYVLVLAVLLIGGISYGYTFFIQNKKIASGSITTANLTINFSNLDINATNLSIPANDQEGLSEFSKSVTITNTTNVDGKVELSLTRTSGLQLTDMRYATSINGAIQEIDDVPSDGEILSSAIMGNDTMDVEVMLWPKSTYSGSTRTFSGELSPEISYLGNTATDTTNLTGKYVNFNGNEVWRIVKTEDDRLVLTRQADYTNATSRTNSNKYNLSLTFNDNSMITSVSTDNKNVYLAKTTKITSGSGTQEDPYTLVNNEFREEDKKVIAVITYKHETETVGTQNIYYNETNYISQIYDDPDFSGWSDGTNEYQFGSVTNINTDTNLTAIIVPRLRSRIINLCNDSNITYVQKYNTANGLATDTPDGSGNEDVCYYTSPDSTNTAAQNSNVIFGNFCWQIVRTTADGGVKLIYNGRKTNDDKCPNDSSLRPIEQRVSVQNNGWGKDISGSKLYGDSYDIINDNGTYKFKLNNPTSNSWSNSTYQNLIGKYVCGTSSSPTGTSDTCEYVYYIGQYISNSKADYVSYRIINTSNTYWIAGGSSFNTYDNAFAGVSYMFNDTYNYSYNSNLEDSYQLILADYGGTWYFGDKATWNTSTLKYDLTIDDGEGHDITPTSTSDWSSIRSQSQGMYTCKSSMYTSCEEVYYIVANSTSSVMYGFLLSNAETINTKGITLNYSSSYNKVGNNYVLDDPHQLTILLKDWYTTYNNSSYSNIYVCSDFTSSSCSELYYISRTSTMNMYYNKSSNNYLYGNNVTYLNGSYTINQDNDPTKYQYIWDWGKNYNTITNSHYTCYKTDTNACDDTVYFIFETSGRTHYYLALKNGDTIESVLNKLFNVGNSSSSTLNRYDSSIKGVIDNWYARNLTSLASYLDNNAVFCNDRSTSSIGGLSRTGANTSEVIIRFNHNSSPNPSTASLSCPLITDRFSKNNTNIAELKYPVGLLTEDERALMGMYYAKTGSDYWTMTPRNYYNNQSRVHYVNSTGVSTDNYVTIHASGGVRPVITLKPGVAITGGNGTYDTPYIIDTSS